MAVAAGRRPPALSGLVIGLLIFIAGAIMAGPSLVARLRFTAADGVLRNVYADPGSAGDRRRLVLHYSFAIAEPDRAWGPVRVEALGTGLCDAAGRPLDDPQVADVEAEGRIASLGALADRAFLVYYDATDPAGTARLCLEPGALWRFDLGLLLMATPVMVSLGMWIAATGYRRTMAPSRGGPARPEA